MVIYSSYPLFFPHKTVFCISLLAQGPRDQQNHLWNSENLVTKALILPSILLVARYLVPFDSTCCPKPQTAPEPITYAPAFRYGRVTSSHSHRKPKTIMGRTSTFSPLLTWTTDNNGQLGNPKSSSRMCAGNLSDSPSSVTWGPTLEHPGDAVFHAALWKFSSHLGLNKK